VIDLHCHHLPGIDDGAPDMETALALLEASAADGITEAVLTPHVYPGRWDNTLSSLRPVFAAFKQAAEAAAIPVTLHLGGEVHLLPEALHLCDEGDLPLIGLWQDLRVVLLEFPDGQIPVGALKAVAYLRQRGIVPMIAHPERNKDVMRDPLRLKPFVDAGCLIQVTAASIAGRFGRRALQTSIALLERDWITAVATDAHNLKHRPPMLSDARDALVRLAGEIKAADLTEINPGIIVAGRNDPAFPAV